MPTPTFLTGSQVPLPAETQVWKVYLPLSFINKTKCYLVTLEFES